MCMICKEDATLGEVKTKELINDRLWAVDKESDFHECKHLSVFENSGTVYRAFICRKSDNAMTLISKYGMSKWKDKVWFHGVEEGATEEQFIKIIKELADEIYQILNTPDLIDRDHKIQLLVIDKLEGYKEVVREEEYETHFMKYMTP